MTSSKDHLTPSWEYFSFYIYIIFKSSTLHWFEPHLLSLSPKYFLFEVPISVSGRPGSRIQDYRYNWRQHIQVSRQRYKTRQFEWTYIGGAHFLARAQEWHQVHGTKFSWPLATLSEFQLLYLEVTTIKSSSRYFCREGNPKNSRNTISRKTCRSTLK